MNIHGKKLYIYENIDKSSNHNTIIKLLNDNECKYTKNSNGIFLNLNTLSDELIQNIYDILFFNNDKQIYNINEESYEDTLIKQYHQEIPTHSIQKKIKQNVDIYLLENFTQKEQEIILFSKKYYL